jgi:hypothetical protein
MQIGERDELVQHRPLGRAPSISGDRLSGRAGRAFVEAAREHAAGALKFSRRPPRATRRLLASYRVRSSDAGHEIGRAR